MTTQKTLSSGAWAELILLGLIWGGIFLATRVALDEIPVATSVAWRTGLAALLLWAVVIAGGLTRPLTRADLVGFLGMGILNNLIPFTLLNWSQLHLPSGLVSIFNGTTAIFGVLVAAMFFADERLSLRKGIGVGLGFAGVGMAAGIGSLTAFNLASLPQMAALLATLSYAMAGVWARKRLSHMAPQLAAAGMLSASALLSIPMAFAMDGPMTVTLSGTTWAAIAYMAIVGTALAYLLYYRVLARAGSGNLMLVTLVIPPVAIALGAWVRGETLPASALWGFGLLALGMLVIDGRIFRRRARHG